MPAGLRFDLTTRMVSQESMANATAGRSPESAWAPGLGVVWQGSVSGCLQGKIGRRYWRYRRDKV